jgi:hypothetical protein
LKGLSVLPADICYWSCGVVVGCKFNLSLLSEIYKMKRKSREEKAGTPRVHSILFVEYEHLVCRE